FASDRTGVEDLYLLEPDDAETPELTKAHKFKATQLTHGKEEESGPSFSPKGDKIAFLRAGQLWTMNANGTGAKVLVAETKITDYDWSPDGKWVVFARMDGSFASELYIVPTDGAEAPRNVSRYATFNGDVTWSATGHRLGFLSNRRGTSSMHVLDLKKPSAPGSRGPKDEIDWDDIHLRVTRPANMPAEGGSISPDGSQVAFRSDSGRAGDLWVVSSDGGNINRATSGGVNPKAIRWSRKSPGTIFFLNGDGELRTTRASFGPAPGSAGPGGPTTEPGRVAFAATLTVRRDEEYGEMFTQCWRALADQFYDTKFHGADWTAVREKYRPFVGHVAQKEDLYALVLLMLGELNASHLGITGRLPIPAETTAELGLVFDPAFPGPGLKVTEIVKRGPADRKGLGVAPGDIVLSLNRTALTDKVNVPQLLAGKAGEPLTLEVTSAPTDPKARRKVELTPASRTKMAELMYDRWMQKNADQIARQSGGRLGYIHIPSMNEEGLEVFVRSLYSDNFDKDGIVIDVRYNGGGFTHDQVLNYLNGKEHTVFRQRNGGEGSVMRNYDRKWAKPAAVLINNRSFSDAEIFPHAFRESGVGKVVGQATGGHVIGTSSTKLIDGSDFRLPRIGVYTTRGVNMDKEGVKPDVPAELDPDDWAKGVDTQVSKAVDVLRADVTAWKSARGLIGTAPTPRAVAPTTPTPAATMAKPAAPAASPAPAATATKPTPAPVGSAGSAK
ncbi:MAG: S41 family peptidase, partial [Fimbriiglobus sp.]